MRRMRIDRESGLLRRAGEEVRYVPSPNRDERPAGAGVELVVVHGISLPPGELGGPWIERLFTNRLDPEAHPFFAEIEGLRVSAHVLIRRDGEVVQFVPFHERAWHAGVSEWLGREAVNDFSVGVELEGARGVEYEGVQYERLAEVLRALEGAYPAFEAERGRVVGHSDVAPGRKWDPGPSFDWERLWEVLEG